MTYAHTDLLESTADGWEPDEALTAPLEHEYEPASRTAWIALTGYSADTAREQYCRTADSRHEALGHAVPPEELGWNRAETYETGGWALDRSRRRPTFWSEWDG